MSPEASAIAAPFYTILLNNREMGTIRIKDPKAYMDKYFPGATYEVKEDESIINASATVVQMLEIREHRTKAHVIKD